MKPKILRNPNSPNMDIRRRMYENGIQHQELARQIGISKFWLCKLLGKELSPENKERFNRGIDELIEER